MLKIKNVQKSFGDIIALSEVSFDVDDGEFVFITGPSGAGKTTLIRLILREILPDQGEIWLDETDITKLKVNAVPEFRQQVGVVFQDFKVLPEQTLRENIEIALAVINLQKAQWNERVEQVMDLVGLADRADLFPAQLSGGELQRTSLARALVVDPKLNLADEPTGNLDWETADAMMELFEKINKKGKTIVMATHHKGIVDKMKKKVIRLGKGKIKKSENESDKKESTKDEKIKK